MKHLIYLLTAVIMVSCGSNTSDKTYEKTITDYLLKDSYTKENLNFKIIEIEEVGEITVADSIDYLTDEFRKDKQFIIDRVTLAKETTEELLSKKATKHNHEKYIADIAIMNNRIDSLKNLKPDNLQGYESRNGADILAKIVRCKYAITIPGTTSVEETFDFFLSPDGNKCFGQKRAE